MNAKSTAFPRSTCTIQSARAELPAGPNIASSSPGERAISSARTGVRRPAGSGPIARGNRTCSTTLSTSNGAPHQATARMAQAYPERDRGRSALGVKELLARDLAVFYREQAYFVHGHALAARLVG